MLLQVGKSSEQIIPSAVVDGMLTICRLLVGNKRRCFLENLASSFVSSCCFQSTMFVCFCFLHERLSQVNSVMEQRELSYIK